MARRSLTLGQFADRTSRLTAKLLKWLSPASLPFPNAHGHGNCYAGQRTKRKMDVTPTMHQRASMGEAFLAPWPVNWLKGPISKNPQASYYGARYYDSSAGRFLSEDLLRFDGAERNPNLYWYVRNSSTNAIDPLGLWPQVPNTEPILPSLMCPWCNQFSLGAGDMWVNYRRMEETKWVRGDKYYHCVANCQATNQGPGGAVAAKVISFLRTNVRSRITEPADWRNDDKANKCGQQGGDCEKTCAQFVPKYSPGKPTFHW